MGNTLLNGITNGHELITLCHKRWAEVESLMSATVKRSTTFCAITVDETEAGMRSC